LNVGYTIVGQPGPIHLDNIFDFAVAEEWHAIPAKFDVMAEFLANTASAPESPEGSATTTAGTDQITPEAAWRRDARDDRRSILFLLERFCVSRRQLRQQPSAAVPTWSDSLGELSG
jgi:hypothetical protein